MMGSLTPSLNLTSILECGRVDACVIIQMCVFVCVQKMRGGVAGASLG